MPFSKRWSPGRGKRWLLPILALLAVVCLWCGLVPFRQEPAGVAPSVVSETRESEPSTRAESEGLDASERAPARVRSEAPDLHVLSLRVVEDPGHEPVAAARVWFLSRGQVPIELGESGADGLLEVRIERTGRGSLLVIAEGFAAHEAVLPSPLPEHLGVTLERAGRIRGRVVWAGGEPLDSGLVALAWPSEYELSPERLRTAMALGHDGRIATVPVAADGRFELRGLRAHRRYTVSAGGPGCLVVKATQGIQPGSSELELTLSAIHGTAIVIEGDSGVSLAADDALASEPTTVSALAADVQWLTGARWMPHLALVGGEELLASVQRHGWSFSTYLFATGNPCSGVEFDLGLEPPGYVPTRRRLFAPRILKDLELQRVQIADGLGINGRGVLRVQFVGPGAALLRDVNSDEGTRAYLILLRAEEPGGRPFQIALDLPQDDGRRIVGLPVGEYRAIFRFERGTWSPSGESLAVSILPGGAESMLVCELQGFGMAVVEVIDEGGRPFDGRIHLSVGREIERRSGTRYRSVAEAFPSGPYVFGPLSPGPYIAQVDSFPGRKVRRDARITFEVVENGLAFPTMALTDFLEP